MKNTLILAAYFNNPHFISLQHQAFKLFVQDEYDFTVLDDSTEDVKSILTGKRARDEILSECHRLGVNHLAVPQTIHAYKRHGGYTPDENATIDHPTERHQAIFAWLFEQHKNLGFDQYKTLVLLDADVLVKQPINFSTYMDHDIIGTFRDQDIKLPLGKFDDRLFPPHVKEIDGQTIRFLTIYITLFNMQKVSNLETLNIGTWPHTDTGGRTYFFLRDNPQYSRYFLHERHDSEHRIDVISKDPNFTAENAEFIHYRAGSNWLYEQADYYREKLNRMLQHYIPALATNITPADRELRSRDGEHVLVKR